MPPFHTKGIGLSANNLLRRKIAQTMSRGVEDVAPYKKTQHAARRRDGCSYRLFDNGRIISSPTEGYMIFYGFTPKLVLHFVGADVLDCPREKTDKNRA